VGEKSKIAVYDLGGGTSMFPCWSSAMAFFMCCRPMATRGWEGTISISHSRSSLDFDCESEQLKREGDPAKIREACQPIIERTRTMPALDPRRRAEPEILNEVILVAGPPACRWCANS